MVSLDELHAALPLPVHPSHLPPCIGGRLCIRVIFHPAAAILIHNHTTLERHPKPLSHLLPQARGAVTSGGKVKGEKGMRRWLWRLRPSGPPAPDCHSLSECMLSSIELAQAPSVCCRAIIENLRPTRPDHAIHALTPSSAHTNPTECWLASASSLTPCS
jgi:hypothetical protein